VIRVPNRPTKREKESAFPLRKKMEVALRDSREAPDRDRVQDKVVADASAFSATQITADVAAISKLEVAATGLVSALHLQNVKTNRSTKKRSREKYRKHKPSFQVAAAKERT